MSRKIIGLIAFIATGIGLLGETVIQGQSAVTITGIIAVIALFSIGLLGHYRELTK